MNIKEYKLIPFISNLIHKFYQKIINLLNDNKSNINFVYLFLEISLESPEIHSFFEYDKYKDSLNYTICIKENYFIQYLIKNESMYNLF